MGISIQAKINKIAKKVGVVLSPRDPHDSYLWNGKNVGVGGLSASNQLHEIGHWLVASPAMRMENDFGLGPGPESGLDVLVKEDDSMQCEELASLVGIAYEAYIGMPYEKTLMDHAWIGGGCEKEDCESFWKCIQTLQEMGLLDGHLPVTR